MLVQALYHLQYIKKTVKTVTLQNSNEPFSVFHQENKCIIVLGEVMERI